MSSLKLDLAQMNKAIATAFDPTVDYQSEVFKDEFVQEKWKWPRLTKRRNGTTAGTTRDIVDSGALADSQTVARSSDGLSAEWTWDTDYSIYVHEGVTLQNGTELPARPWATIGIEDGQPAKKFGDALKKLL